MNKGLDTTMNFEVPEASPGGGGRAPGNRVEGTQRDVITQPSAGGAAAAHRDSEVSKAETSDIINTVFYDNVAKGQPASLDTTMTTEISVDYGR